MSRTLPPSEEEVEPCKAILSPHDPGDLARPVEEGAVDEIVEGSEAPAVENEVVGSARRAHRLPGEMRSGGVEARPPDRVRSRRLLHPVREDGPTGIERAVGRAVGDPFPVV